MTRQLREGKSIAFGLSQDDGFTARVVLGDLAEPEAAEWVGRIVWKLDLAEGLLGIDRWAVAVPPGVYRVDVLGYLPHSQGTWLLSRAPGGDEPPEAYWRRTRPGEAIPPTWIVQQLSPAERRKLPLGPAEREALQRRLEAEESSWVDFVFQLTPLTGQLPMPPFAKGTRRRPSSLLDLVFEWECRKPAACPRGLLTRDLKTLPA